MQETYRVAYALRDYTATIQDDELVLVQCALTNHGSVSWHSDGKRPVNLAYRWFDQHGAPLVADGRRTRLPSVVEPGATVECEVVIEAPPHHTSLILELDLVAEGVAWFSTLGQPTLRIPVRVDQRPANTPRVCIINSDILVKDAVSNYMMDQVRYFHRRGYAVAVLVENSWPGIPLDIRRHVWPIKPPELEAELLSDQPNWAARQFRHADIYIYHYAMHYALIDTIKRVEHGTILFDYHGVTPPEYWADQSLLPLVLRSQKQTQLAHYADTVIVHSPYMIEELAQHSGVNRQRIQCFPYAVPLERFVPKPPDPELLERYQLQGMYVLLYTGRMAGNKRIDDLVRILANVRQTYPNTKLFLVGNNTDPQYRATIEEAVALAADLGCSDHVIFTGSVSLSDLIRFYNLCHVYVTASLHEGFCIPVIEAMACGKPVVATEAAALPSTIGDAGLLFPPKDTRRGAEQVLRLLADALPHPALSVAQGG